MESFNLDIKQFQILDKNKFYLFTVNLKKGTTDLEAFVTHGRLFIESLRKMGIYAAIVPSDFIGNIEAIFSLNKEDSIEVEKYIKENLIK